MKKILIIIQFILLHSLHAEIYQDRILVYIDNSIEDFDLNEDLFRTNLKDLNELMDIIIRNDNIMKEIETVTIEEDQRLAKLDEKNV